MYLRPKWHGGGITLVFRLAVRAIRHHEAQAVALVAGAHAPTAIGLATVPLNLPVVILAEAEIAPPKP